MGKEALKVDLPEKKTRSPYMDESMSTPIEIIPISSAEEEFESRWNQFVENESNNGTIFHRLDFLDYHGNRFKENEHHLLFKKKGKIVAVLPLGFFDTDSGLTAKSPFGASWGGLVTASRLPLADVESIASLLTNYLKEQQVHKLEICQAPSIYELEPNDYFLFLLQKLGAKQVGSDLTSYLRVREDPIPFYTPTAKNRLRQAIKAGIQVSESNDIDTFYTILAKSREKFGVLPTHSKEEVAWLCNAFPDRVKIHLAKHEGEAVACSLTFACNRRSLQLFYWAHIEEQKHLRPVNYLSKALNDWAFSKGFKFLDLGPQTDHQEINYGGSVFKESFGANGIFRSRMALTI